MAYNNTYININDFINLQRESEIYDVGADDMLSKLNEPQRRIFSSKVCVTTEEIKNAYCETIQQYDSPRQVQIREPRVSSRKAQKIKARTTKDCKELATELLDPAPKFRGNKHTDYGLQMREPAIKKYSSDYNVVAGTGVVIHSRQPWICGTSDGIVIGESGNPLKILKVKCPSLCRSTGIVSESGINAKYLEHKNNTYYLKQSSPEYTQCQILLYVTGLKSCDFFVYSKINQVLVEVPRDELFLSKVIPKICSFYFDYMLPELVKKYDH